ncbi:hypothetical protein PAHAL_5G006800 [Panicum hallii]|uniref:Rho-GAP domain-containing protein n=1 Tax=Panicum hallii TaxID=206008 RepID=A0A2T8IIE1_9POAL|nr:hypothetical protein PAHAL_5G006800 [Panicum hallii]
MDEEGRSDGELASYRYSSGAAHVAGWLQLRMRPAMYYCTACIPNHLLPLPPRFLPLPTRSPSTPLSSLLASSSDRSINCLTRPFIIASASCGPPIRSDPIEREERQLTTIYMMQGGGGDDDETAAAAGGLVDNHRRRQQQQQPLMMEIGWPTDVRHVAHVTFDRFHGFRGVPEDLQPEVEVRGAPSASKTVFGVSTESMQCSYDARGNSVPTILLHLQRRLYDQGGLATEGIFRITAEAGQEQRARDQLNTSGVVPDGVDVHCLAGLIKAWFRELPGGLLDALPADEVMRCQTEDDCVRLCATRLTPPKAALLDWAVNLMADVAREEKANKMGTRNVAMVFAPNMTQVMNLLNMLIERALKKHQPSPPDHPSSSSSSAAAARP